MSWLLHGVVHVLRRIFGFAGAHNHRTKGVKWSALSNRHIRLNVISKQLRLDSNAITSHRFLTRTKHSNARIRAHHIWILLLFTKIQPESESEPRTNHHICHNNNNDTAVCSFCCSLDCCRVDCVLPNWHWQQRAFVLFLVILNAKQLFYCNQNTVIMCQFSVCAYFLRMRIISGFSFALSFGGTTKRQMWEPMQFYFQRLLSSMLKIIRILRGFLSIQG